MIDESEVVEAIAEELRTVADELENEDLQLTEPPTYTMKMGDDRPQVELTYYAEGYGYRTIEVSR